MNDSVSKLKGRAGGGLGGAPLSVPMPLRGILGVALFFAVAWAYLVPPFQAPDEIAHFGYVQSIVERRALPGGQATEASESSELSATVSASGVNDVIFHQDAQPPFGPAARHQLDAVREGASAANGGGPGAATSYPPAAYAAMALGYAAVADGTVETRLFAARIVSALWILLTVTGAWLLAGEVFGRRRLAQSVAAATVGLWPMNSFITGAVNVDGLLLAAWAIVAWSGVRAVRQGLDVRTGLVLGVASGVALVTKATSLALLPAVIFAIVVGGVAVWKCCPRRSLVAAGCAAMALVLVGGSWSLYTVMSGRAAYAQVGAAAGGGGVNLREMLSYLWQFYLPRLPSMTEQRNLYPVISELPAYNTWLGGSTGVFGWVNVWLPHRIYVAYAVTLGAFFALAAVWLVRTRRGPSSRSCASARGWYSALFLFLLCAGLLAGLHLTDYRMLAAGATPFVQGRYLLPILPVLGLIFGAAVLAFPRLSVPIASTVIGCLVAMQIISISAVVERYYV